MKAYSVSDQNGDTGFSYIIFAETRGQAIRYALSHCDGCFDYYEFPEMRAIRKPQLDKCYRGEWEMDWCRTEDRIAMVRDAGFECSGEVDITREECEECPAKQWCGRYEREYKE